MDRDSNIKNVIEKLDGFYESLSKGERMKFDISYLRKANVYLADLKKENEMLVKQLCEKEDMIREAEGRFYELQKQLSEKKPEWISVEDRLPGTRDNVLAYDINDIGTIYIAFYFDGLWRQDDIPHVGVDTITHWMPLPEPPKPKVPTFKDVFLEKFPKTCNVCFVDFCPKTFFESIKCPLPVVCSEKTIEACWNQPCFEEEEKE